VWRDWKITVTGGWLVGVREIVRLNCIGNPGLLISKLANFRPQTVIVSKIKTFY